MQITVFLHRVKEPATIGRLPRRSATKADWLQKFSRCATKEDWPPAAP